MAGHFCVPCAGRVRVSLQGDGTTHFRRRETWAKHRSWGESRPNFCVQGRGTIRPQGGWSRRRGWCAKRAPTSRLFIAYPETYTMQVFGSAFRGAILALRKASPEVWMEYGVRTPQKVERLVRETRTNPVDGTIRPQGGWSLELPLLRNTVNFSARKPFTENLFPSEAVATKSGSFPGHFRRWRKTSGFGKPGRRKCRSPFGLGRWTFSVHTQRTSRLWWGAVGPPRSGKL